MIVHATLKAMRCTAGHMLTRNAFCIYLLSHLNVIIFSYRASKARGAMESHSAENGEEAKSTHSAKEANKMDGPLD